VNLFFALAIPTLAGFLLAAWFLSEDKEFSFFDKLFLGYGLGLGFLSYTMFVIGVFGPPYTIFTITSVQVFFTIILLYLMYRNRGIKDVVFPGGLRTAGNEAVKGVGGWKLYLSAFLAVWLFLKIGIVSYECMVRPMYALDTWANWSSGAKFFFFEKGLVLDQADEHFFGRGYRAFLGHPLHTPLLQVWISLWQGEFHDAYAKAWSAFYFISLLGIFFLAVKRETDWFYGFVSVFFLSSVPLLVFHGIEGYADLPLAYYGLASAVCLWKYLNSGKNGYISLCGIFIAFACFTKNEGLLFFLAIAAALTLFIFFEKKRALPTFAHFLLPFVVLVGPWFLFKFINGLGFGHSGVGSAMVWFSDPKFGQETPRGIRPEILFIAFKEIFFKANFNLIIPFWLFVSVVGVKTIMRTNIKYLFVVILAVMAMFIFIYLLLEVTTVVELTGFNRNALTYVSIIFFASALLTGRIWHHCEKELSEDSRE
jgi:hypothetical protein